MKTQKIIYFVFAIFVINNFCLAQQVNLKKLEAQIAKLNDELQYDESIEILTDLIHNKSATSYDKYYAYLLKSYTYKRVFNYTKTLQALDFALKEGLNSEQKDQVVNTIIAEKSFVFFDTQDYQKAEVLMSQLRRLDYKHLTTETKSWLIMQEGYINMLNKDYQKAEQLLNEAIALIQSNSPEDVPNIYGKKMELYNQMKLFDKRDATFKEGLKIAKAYHKVKYEMYLYQVMRNIFQENEDYKNAFYTQKKYDSIVKFYNATEASSKIELTEKQLEEQNTKLKALNQQYLNYILYGVITSLFLLLFFVIKLYQSNKSRRILMEKENTRIHHEIEQLTKSLDEKGNATIDLTSYNLTDRQLEIIGLIKNGLTNKEIATKLFISENTVKYHLKIIYEVLDVEHRSAIK